MPQTSDLLTLREAAIIAGLTHATLRQQAIKGRLKAQKVGRDWTVTRKALDAYLANVRRAAPRSGTRPQPEER